MLIIATMFTACDKKADEVITEPQTYDYNVEKIAQATAHALQDEEFRSYIQSEAAKMFDGDYNFLIKDALNHKFGDGMTFRDKLSHEFVSVETFNQFIENTPKLQIAVPVYIGKWNTKTFVPSVAFLNENFDDKTTEFISAFDASQNLIQVAVKEEPNVPFVVISLNERVDNNGNLKEEKPANDKVRYDGGMEQITKMRFDNLSAVEPWILGGPELRLQIRPAFWNTPNSVSFLEESFIVVSLI
ncbi:MAG: DUF3103 family protein [Saprospiraceae bacterium]|nr:DUF3103 family protein [Saprospiraceae bacterium]